MKMIGAWWLVAAAPIALAGCSSQVDKAEQRYAIVEKSGDAAALCAEGRKLAEAYLDAGDAEAYNRRKLETDIACTGRELDEKNGDFRMNDGTTRHFDADNLEALVDETLDNTL